MATRFRSFIRSALVCSTNKVHDVDVDVSHPEDDSCCQSSVSTSELYSYIKRIMRIGQSMDDLPDDILHLLIEVMIRDRDLSSIKQFSQVSRRARNISIPCLFREHCWRPRQQGDDLLPVRFWRYVRHFHLMLYGSMFKVAENSMKLAAALPHMTNIVKVRITGILDHRWQELIIRVASLPQLSALEFVCSVRYMTLMTPPTRFATPPTRIVLHFHETWHNDGMHRPEPLSAISTLCAGTVEYLELCENAVHLDGLNAHEWPKLREFVICGHSHPPGTSITDVLERMPQLRKLDLSYRCRPDSTQLVVWTPSTSGKSPSTILSQLTSLVITDPSNFGDTFSYLPDTLESLSILATSRLQVLGHHELFHMLGTVRSPNLTTLRFVMNGPLDDTLFSFINTTFPLLEVLGIHRFTVDGIGEPHEVAAKLQCFKHLKLLQLNIGFHADPLVGDPANILPRRWADTIASHLPWIKEIAFATPLTPFNQHWLTFTVGSHHSRCSRKLGNCATHSLVPLYIELPL